MQVLLAPGATMKVLNVRCVDEIDDDLRIKMAKNFETGWGLFVSSIFSSLLPSSVLPLREKK